MISVLTKSHCFTIFDFVKLGLEDYLDKRVFNNTVLHFKLDFIAFVYWVKFLMHCLFKIRAAKIVKLVFKKYIKDSSINIIT